MEDYKSQATELLKAMNSEGWAVGTTTDEAIELIRDFQANYMNTYEIVSYEEINEMVRERLDNGDWKSVKCFLSGAEINSSMGYYLDGYDNVETINKDWIIMKLEEVLSEIKYNED